ncbi:MAG: sodium:proton antiporter [Legionellales bacterium]|nr:sodium:proton antiporter [Legionellales bacterium]
MGSYGIIGAVALQQQQLSISLLKILEHTDAAKALFIGGAASLITVLLITFPQRYDAKQYVRAMIAGCKAMMPVLYILLAWLIIMIIEDLQTGLYLAGLIHANLALAWLPVLFFIIAGLTALATGTSWGTFGLMLPLAGDISVVLAPEMLLFNLAAALSGALFGDHASPISDTTIMSSAGASCHHIDHVVTQLPYALLASLMTMGGLVVLGWTQSAVLSYLGWAAIGTLIFWGVRWMSRAQVAQ